METDRERGRERESGARRFPSIREEFGRYKAEKTPAGNKQGYKIEYAYIGDYYTPNDDALKLKKVKIRMGILCAAGLAFHLAGILQKSYVNSERIVFGGSLLSILLLFFEASGVLQFLMTKGMLTERQFADLSLRLKIMPLFHGGLLIVCAVSAAAAAVRGPGGAAAYLTALSYALSGISSICIFLLYRKLEYLRIPTSGY